MKTQKRKLDHLRICLEKDVEFDKSNGFESYELVHNAMPEINFSEIDLSMEFLGKKFKAPILIEAITGGTDESREINRNLARAAQELGIGMGVGSQKAMIENSDLTATYEVRDVAPDIFLLGNIGATQLADFSIGQIEGAVKDIQADGLAIHLNPAQEISQNDGDANWRSVEAFMEKVCSSVRFPVIVKEVGCGINPDVAKRLEKAGVDAIDVAGAGGVSWVKVDTFLNGKPLQNFFEWGIPTAYALEGCVDVVKIPVIASGGIRNGIEAAKAIAMGASLAGLALPLLKPATESADLVKAKLEQILLELKTSMFLVGAQHIGQLKDKILKRTQ